MISINKLGPFRAFMSDYWTENGDLYLGSFDNALEIFCATIGMEEKKKFLEELENVGRSGLVDDIDSPSAFEFWGALGGRALTKQEYMLALRKLTAECR